MENNGAMELMSKAMQEAMSKAMESAAETFADTMKEKLSEAIAPVNNKIESIAGDVAKIPDMEKRLFKIENQEEITEDQADDLLVAKKSSVRRVLREIAVKKGMSTNNHFLYDVYGTLLHPKAWTDAQRKAHCGSSYRRTKKEHYPECLAYLETWSPEGGLENFISYAEERNGYKFEQ